MKTWVIERKTQRNALIEALEMYVDTMTQRIAKGYYDRREEEAIQRLESLKPLLEELHRAVLEEDKPEPDYWKDEDARFPVADWKHQVANGDTREGYWAWVASEAEAAREGE